MGEGPARKPERGSHIVGHYRRERPVQTEPGKRLMNWCTTGEAKSPSMFNLRQRHNADCSQNSASSKVRCGRNGNALLACL